MTINKKSKKNLRPLGKKQLWSIIDHRNLPKHVAIIMDGNGRWAKARMLPRVAGHRAGIKTVRKIVEIASDLGIKVLTLYAFSVENWSRPPEEVSALMRLLVEYLKREVVRMQRNNVRFHAIGRLAGLPDLVQQQIEASIKQTRQNTGLLLNIALNYSSQLEIVDAVKGVIQDVEKKRLDIDKLDEKTFSRYLYTGGLPDPDLLIRTSGEMRISNFLLWQLAYAELLITPILWPDFQQRDFLQAILEYQQRERRFGSVGKLVQST
jgi:undecaprenyl diphosphate synthase